MHGRNETGGASGATARLAGEQCHETGMTDTNLTKTDLRRPAAYVTTRRVIDRKKL